MTPSDTFTFDDHIKAAKNRPYFKGCEEARFYLSAVYFDALLRRLGIKDWSPTILQKPLGVSASACSGAAPATPVKTLQLCGCGGLPVTHVPHGVHCRLP